MYVYVYMYVHMCVLLCMYVCMNMYMYKQHTGPSYTLPSHDNCTLSCGVALGTFTFEELQVFPDKRVW